MEMEMETRFDPLVKKAVELGADDARLIRTEAVVFDPRSELKCRFGCARWGRYWTCPPHTGISQERFREAFDRYETALVLQVPDMEKSQTVTLAVEKEAMMHHGCAFAFALALCVQCDPCAHPEPCRHPELARPSMDAYGVDIGKTVAPLGFEVRFDPGGNFVPMWYSMVLLD